MLRHKEQDHKYQCNLNPLHDVNTTKYKIKENKPICQFEMTHKQDIIHETIDTTILKYKEKRNGMKVTHTMMPSDNKP